MANWLIDYIELTECVPIELREQLTSIRELDLQVHNAMDELERGIEQFFKNIDSMSADGKKEQYDMFLQKCDAAMSAACDKVKVADKLHELVEKSMRLLDHGLGKLKDDLIEGDKGYIVEDIERKSKEIEEQLKVESENMLQKYLKVPNNTHSNNQNKLSNKTQNNEYNNKNSVLPITKSSHHTKSNLKAFNASALDATLRGVNLGAPGNSKYHPNSQHQPHQRRRNHSIAGGQISSAAIGKNRKRERKRQLSSNMSVFNSNANFDDNTSVNASSNFASLGHPSTVPSKLYNSGSSGNQQLQQQQHTAPCMSASMTDGIEQHRMTLKNIITGNRNQLPGFNDKIISDSAALAQAKQPPVLTAMDAAHAVSPKATNSDKLHVFSNNSSSNGDMYRNQSDNSSKHNNDPCANKMSSNNSDNNKNYYHYNISNTGNHHNKSPLPAFENYSSSNQQQYNARGSFGGRVSDAFGAVATSQVINAAQQQMSGGRLASGLKASYASVNSGGGFAESEPLPVTELYCTCRTFIQGSDMIACDNEHCKYEWFHYQCAGVKKAPEGEWYCPECRLSLLKNKISSEAKLEQSGGSNGLSSVEGGKSVITTATTASILVGQDTKTNHENQRS